MPFGAEYSSIRPLGLKKIEERYEESIKYWCANLTKEELSGVGVTVFPLLTLENAEDEVFSLFFFLIHNIFCNFSYESIISHLSGE